jgi:hypothetical protein
MLMNHTQAFADAFPAALAPLFPRRSNPANSVLAGTRLETPNGWRDVETLRPKDRVATLDGGFAPLVSVRRQIQARAETDWLLPAGSMNNCSDLTVVGGQNLAFFDPACNRLFQTDCVLAPVNAMAGFRGIRPAPITPAAHTFALTFADEEIIYAQTGALLHVPAPAPAGDGFFRTLSYGETRALLMLMDTSQYGPDTLRAAA